MAESVSTQPAITLRTLGELRLEGPLTERLNGKCKALVVLACLARQSPRAIPRERLSQLLWGNRSNARARQSLRQALLELRRSIGTGLEVTAERVLLRMGTVELDVTAFEREVAQGNFHAAAARWRGDFLEGIACGAGDAFGRWLDAERGSLRRQLSMVLSGLAHEAASRADWAAAERWASQWGHAFPLDEAAHLHWMQALRMMGRPMEGLALHATFLARSRVEFGEAPSPQLDLMGQHLEGDARQWSRARDGHQATICSPEFAGHHAVLAAAITAWEDVLQGASAIVLVEGDRGMGKSRMCREVVRAIRARKEPLVVLEASGATNRAPHGLAREMLHDLRDARGLAGAAPRALAELASVAPWVCCDFVDLPLARGTERALVQGVREALSAVAEEQPMVCVVDDVLEGDDASVALLCALVQELPRRVMFLLTSGGDNPGHKLTQSLADAPGLRRLRLQPLPTGDVDAMLASMIPMRECERRVLATRLAAGTGGNPFCITEVVSALAAQGWLAPDGSGGWAPADAYREHALPLPARVRSDVVARLERLDPSARRLLSRAATLGTPFCAEALREGSGLSSVAFESGLDDLIARRLICYVPTGLEDLAFTQPLLRRVVAQMNAKSGAAYRRRRERFATGGRAR